MIPNLKMKTPTRQDVAVMHAQAQHPRECACHLCNDPFAPKDAAEAWQLEKAAMQAGVLARRSKMRRPAEAVRE